MFSKIKELIGSLRFWIVTLTAVLAVLQQVAGGTVDIVSVIDILQTWLGVVVGIGTLDSVALKLGAAFKK